MHTLLVGVGVGLVSLLPPGPVTITLLEVSSRRGQSAALRGGLGIASGDLAVAPLAVALVGAGTVLPEVAFTATQRLAAASLVLLGIALATRPAVCGAVVAKIERPGRAFFLITSLTPTVLTAWIALLAAMPFADDLRALSWFALGVIVASFVWHPLLGLTVAAFGRHADERRRYRLSRLGGLATIAMGAVALIAQF